MFLIGFTGRAGSGKDTAGQVLVRQLGFKRYAFADPIKKALNAMFGWHMGMWENRDWKEGDLPGMCYSPRLLAQTMGTEWGRSIDPEFWPPTDEAPRSVLAARVDGSASHRSTDPAASPIPDSLVFGPAFPVVWTRNGVHGVDFR